MYELQLPKLDFGGQKLQALAKQTLGRAHGLLVKFHATTSINPSEMRRFSDGSDPKNAQKHTETKHFVEGEPIEITHECTEKAKKNWGERP